MCSNNIIYTIYVEVSGKIAISTFLNKADASLTYYTIKDDLLKFYPTFDIECGDKIYFLKDKIGEFFEIPNLRDDQIIDKVSAF